MIKKQKIKFTSSIDFNQFELGDKFRLMQEFTGDKNSKLGHVQKNGDWLTSMGMTNINAPALHIRAKLVDGKFDKIEIQYEKQFEKGDFENKITFERDPDTGDFIGSGNSEIDKYEYEYTLDQIETMMDKYSNGEHSGGKPINVSLSINCSSLTDQASKKLVDHEHCYTGKTGKIKDIAPRLHEVIEIDKNTKAVTDNDLTIKYRKALESDKDAVSILTDAVGLYKNTSKSSDKENALSIMINTLPTDDDKLKELFAKHKDLLKAVESVFQAYPDQNGGIKSWVVGLKDIEKALGGR